MALSTSATSLISTGVQTLGDYFFGKGARDAAKDAAKAQAKLAELQQEEQRLKNRALAMSLPDQNDTVPFANSLPSSRYIRTTAHGALPEDFAADGWNDNQSGALVPAPGFNMTSLLVLVAVGVGAFLLARGGR